MTLNWPEEGRPYFSAFIRSPKKIITESKLRTTCIWYENDPDIRLNLRVYLVQNVQIEIFIAKHFTLKVGLVAPHQHLSHINGRST